MVEGLKVLFHLIAVLLYKSFSIYKAQLRALVKDFLQITTMQLGLEKNLSTSSLVLGSWPHMPLWPSVGYLQQLSGWSK